jgi:multicomponent Na+:H+ antiporter subunit E
MTAVYAFVWYLLLIFVGESFEAGSFIIPYPEVADIVLGLLACILVAVITRNYFAKNDNYRMLNPVRWVKLALYSVLVLFVEMAKANYDVAKRVVTGEIRPGIVRIKPGLKQDLSVALLANSITLTPGTLTVDVDPESNDLFIHWINVPLDADPTEKIAGRFLKWIRGIAE